MPKKAAELKPTQLKSRIEKLQMKPNGGRFAVGGVDGLYLRVIGESTHWVLCVAMGTRTNRKGDEVVKRLNMGLGPYPEVSLTDAREIAKRRRAKIRDGIDPLAEKRSAAAAAKALEQAEAEAKAKAKTFKHCAEQVIALKAQELTNAKALAQWESTFRTYVFDTVTDNGEKFGDRIVSTLTKQDVAAVLKPIWATKHETASRLRQRIEAAFEYARAHDYFVGNNPAEWKGALRPMLGTVTVKEKHHAALPYGEMGAFMADLRTREGMSARALEFLILTATRFGEVVQAMWDEINLKAKVWTIPEGRMKARKAHEVPLSDEAVALLEALPRVDGCSYLFVSPRNSHFSNGVFDALLERMKRTDITAHGFRSTFRDWAGEMTAHPREVIEHALAHQLKDKAEAAYQRGTLMPKRARLMADWATYCGMIQPQADNVVPINQAAA